MELDQEPGFANEIIERDLARLADLGGVESATEVRESEAGRLLISIYQCIFDTYEPKEGEESESDNLEWQIERACDDAYFLILDFVWVMNADSARKHPDSI